jgi:hypothetical protein
MKKNRGDKPSGVKIHLYMEISRWNSLHSYFYLKLKHNVFILIFSHFSPTKSENRSEGWHQWEGVGIGERGRRAKTVQKMCKHISACKYNTCWKYSRNWMVEELRTVEEVNSCMIYLIHCNNLVNDTMYPQPSQQ